jgi:hypothetical protein
MGTRGKLLAWRVFLTVLFDMGRIGAMEPLKRGQIVEVEAYGGERLKRRVVSDLGDTVIVSAEKEFQAALNGEREPEGVGFPRRDVKGG